LIWGYEAGVASRFLDLADALEALLDGNINLITVRGLKRPRFREEVEATRVLIYEANDDQAAA
jgi:predicted nucleotidyltransferase